MNLIHPSVEFLWHTPKPLQAVEIAGRTCYKSEDKINEFTAGVFLNKLISQGHDAMIEHAVASVKVICDRGVTHEIVRHRLFSYAQESTRYCNYKGGVTFIIPPWIIDTRNIHEGEFDKGWNRSLSVSMTPKCRAELHWFDNLLVCEREYKFLLNQGWTPQQARSILPNSLKTEIVITGNMRQWRHFFSLRTAKGAHPQMQQTAKQILKVMWNTEVQPFIAEWSTNDSNNN